MRTRGSLWVAAPLVAGFLSAARAELPEVDNLKLTRLIREHILLTSAEKRAGDMKSYVGRIPKTGVSYAMVPIPGGGFLMGSPRDEPGRQEDEGPQRRIEVGPLWMGRYEVTWNQFEPFIDAHAPRLVDKDSSKPPRTRKEGLADIITSPSRPHLQLDHGMGRGNRPAIGMTQLAASKFCQWLSAQTGHYYRLPTEAEWEYACRAGSATTYSFGNDERLLKEHAVFWDVPGRTATEPVGQRKPNAWGLHDMHGNVWEWCLDQYRADAYQSAPAFVPPQGLYPRVIRGGSWYDDAVDLRSAARLYSEGAYGRSDPLAPRSLWFLTDAPWLGFRIVRPLEIPSAEVMHALWNPGDVSEVEAVNEEFRRKRQ